MQKIKTIIYIITIMSFLVSCQSAHLTYSNYSPSLLDELVDYHREVIDNQLVILPVIINNKKEEICINSDTFHVQNESKNIPLDSSLTLLISGLRGKYIQDADIFSEHIIDQQYYNRFFESSDLEEILKQSINASTIGRNGNVAKLKFSIRDIKYIAALIKYLAINEYRVSVGSYVGGYDVIDLTKRGRLGMLFTQAN